MTDTAWPALPYEAWKDTCDTLHLWLQVVGKVRLKLTPWMNHSWNATFYVTPDGLTTSPIPTGQGSLEIRFDFRANELIFLMDDGRTERLPLSASSVADFYAQVRSVLTGLGVEVRINPMPNEIAGAVRFDLDTAPRVYQPAQALDFWRVLVSVDRVFKRFRTAFLGKASPVHLFWGSMDLAVTRFSGRPAPRHPGGVPGLPDDVTREAYSHEVSSAGFWPGQGLGYPAFYSYAYAPPPGFADAVVRPAEARFDAQMGEFILPYDAVRAAPDPEAALLDFLCSTYDAAAEAGGWDRAALECDMGRPGVPRPV